MTAYASTESTVRPCVTDEARTSRKPESGVRISVPAIADKDMRPGETGPEWNIVRGED